MLQDSFDGFQQDFDVQADGPVVDVLCVQFDDFLEVCDLASAGNLPHARKAGFGGQSCAVVVLVFFPFIHRGGPGAYQGHIAFEDVEELGEFIQAGTADLLPDAGDLFSVHDFVADDAGIEVQFEHHAVGDTILSHEFLFSVLRVQVHGPDLVEGEPLSVQPDPGLFEQDRSRAFLFDPRPDHRNEDEGREASDQAAEDIKKSLDKQLEGADVGGRHGQHIVSAHLLQEAFPARAGNREADMDGDGHLPALLDQPGHAGLIRGVFEAALFLCTVAVVDKLLDRAVGSHFQVGQVLRINEHLVDPFPADIVRGVLNAGDDRNSPDGFPASVPVAQDNARVLEAVQVAGLLQNSVNGVFLRHQDHGVLDFPLVDSPDHRLPQQTDTISQD